MNATVEREWTTAAGLPAVVLIAHASHRCGYVGVPKGHPFYGKDYDSPIPEFRSAAQSEKVGKKGVMIVFTASCGALADGEIRPSLDVLIDCHGGLTYAGVGKGYPSETVMDHWWFGFDCAHLGDGLMGPMGRHSGVGDPVRTLEFCVAECESIAQRIVDLCGVLSGVEPQLEEAQ